ncbi:MAG: hypothetical protein ACSW8J_03670, partial [bacterium]
LAELSASSKWSLRNWFGGELPVKFTAQPFAWNVAENVSTQEIYTGYSSIGISVETGLPAPLKVTVENIGSGTISELGVGSGIYFMGLNLSPGQTLTIDTAPPAGAAIGNVSALPCATRFSPVTLHNGANSVPVTFFSVPDGGRARVTVSARGRW